MATIILGAAGQLLGPVGGAIGAILGQQIDARLFAPKARHGPRIGDLSVQTSSYGNQIPKIFGTMRVAGTVIWATDLREQKSSSGGKGQPRTVSYSYSASFAVLLSGRPIAAVGRIWADGKLLRGAAGDFKASTRFRLHRGGEDQPVDPLIAAAEGAGGAPAYRGLAYAVFEDLQLADFGNRIPSLSFELIAEAGPTIGTIVEALTGGEAGGEAGVPLVGYAASGDSVRGALEALGDIAPLSLVEREGRIVVRQQASGEASAIAAADTGASGGGIGGPTELERESEAALPAEVSVVYHEPERDFQIGLQRATRGGGGGLKGDRRSLPAALGAAAAKALAEQRLALAWAGRRRAKLSLPWRLSGVRPGAMLRIAGQGGRWKVERWSLEQMVTILHLCGIPAAMPPAVPATPGRPVPSPDLPHGPTRTLLLDLPLWTDRPPDRPRLLVAAAGEQPGWRGAELLASFDGGASWSAAGRAAQGATMGEAASALPPAGSALLDLAGSVEVSLLGPHMWLEGRSDGALATGANLALLGDELIQFGKADPLGGGRFRLSRLLRGRRGTEWAASGHSAGEPFLLIEAETLSAIEVPAALPEGEARLLAQGIGDEAAGVEAARAVTGEALRPPHPVHLSARPQPDGSIAISWVRRSRNGWSWTSGADTPLGEEREAYRLTLSSPASTRTVILDAAAYSYSAADQAADGVAGALTVEVVQLGTAAPSRPARIVLPQPL